MILETIFKRTLSVHWTVLGIVGLIRLLPLRSRFTSKIFFFDNPDKFLRMDKLFRIGLFDPYYTTNIGLGKRIPRWRKGGGDVSFKSRTYQRFGNFRHQKD